jgi:hypothetical protein
MKLFGTFLTRDLQVDSVNQSFRILTNLIAAGLHHSCTWVDDVIVLLLEFANTILKLRLPDACGLETKVTCSNIFIINLGSP